MISLPAATATDGRSSTPAVDGLRAAVLVVALALAMTLRLAGGGAAAGASKPAGLLFAAVLTAVALLGGLRLRRPSVRFAAAAMGTGLAAAALLCLAPLVHRHGAGMAAVSWPGWTEVTAWSAVTVCIAVSEELVIRGALHDAVTGAAGETAAVLVGAAAFALLHVPLYGTGALPLDLGVGILLGTLRVASGGVLAPATAHVAADLAIWWVW